ncbi:MAG: hypothetical protein M3N02_06755 [Pseudomonadota bacterium]|nr:hypothetical protein [Pseudomonadota bacterium]
MTTGLPLGRLGELIGITAVEPPAPLAGGEIHDLAAVVGRDISTGADREHCERPADLRIGADQPSDSEGYATGWPEALAIVALGLEVRWGGEFMAAFGRDKAAAASELAALVAEFIDRIASSSGP